MLVMWIVILLVILGMLVFVSSVVLILGSAMAEAFGPKNKMRFIGLCFISGAVAAVGFVLLAYILNGVSNLITGV